MIQRKQTIFLLLALVAVVACLMLPVGTYEPTGMGTSDVLTNWTVSCAKTGETDFTPMFLILLLTCPVTLWAIFAYKKRALQARLCVVNIALLLVWYAVYAVYMVALVPDNMTFHTAFAAWLPLIAVILSVMARNGIIADEKLVRAADRIR